MDIVLVEWDDATSDLEATDPEYKGHIVYSVGILARRTKKGIVLFTDYSPTSKEYTIKHTIPNGMIKKVTKLELKESL